MWTKLSPSRFLIMGLAAAIGALVFLAWLANEVLAGDTVLFDEAVRDLIHQYASPSVTWIMQIVTFLGSAYFLIPFGSLVTVVFLLAKWRRALVLFLLTMSGATALNWTLKLIFGRTRPMPFFDIPVPESFSFPSGHALLSLCFYSVLASIIAARVKNPVIRLAVWLIAVLLVVAIGLSRLYLGVHYPSDVLAGYAAAMIWIVTVAIVDHWLLSGKKGGSDAIPQGA